MCVPRNEQQFFGQLSSVGGEATGDPKWRYHIAFRHKTDVVPCWKFALGFLIQPQPVLGLCDVRPVVWFLGGKVLVPLRINSAGMQPATMVARHAAAPLGTQTIVLFLLNEL